MKSFFTYLVLVVLFLASTTLVNRQKKYTRSIQESSLVSTSVLTGMLASNDSQTHPLKIVLKAITNVTQSTTDSSLYQQKQGLVDSIADKKRGRLMVQ